MANAFRTFHERTAHLVNRFTIRSILLVCFAVLIVPGLSLIAFTEWTGDAAIAALDRFIKVENEIADLCLKSITAMSNARRNEKDFILSYREFGFDEARSRYITRLLTNLADVREFMARVRLLADDPEVTHQTAEVERAIGQYQDRLLAMVQKYEAAGSYDSGINGVFRETAHELEALLRPYGNDRLVADLLEMRRREKDFITRTRDSDAALFRGAAGRFRADTARSGLPSATRGKLERLTETYRRGFETYVQTIEEIRTLKKGYLKTLQGIEPPLEKLYLQSNLKAGETLAQIKRNDRRYDDIKTGMSLFALPVALVVAIVISMIISRSVHECKAFAEQIASGNLGSRLVPRGKNEFVTLSHALNNMAESLQHADLARQKWAAELYESEEKIRRLNQELELKVAERTRQLVEAQEELVQKEKLAMLGLLGGSVGNELRNPLGVMNNAVFFLNTVMTDADATVREYLEIIRHEIDNCRNILSDFLDAVRTVPPSPAAAPVDELIRQSLLRCVIPENVELQIGIPETFPKALVDPQQMGKVFQNLISNAVHAMPDGGTLRIRACHVGALYESSLQNPQEETGEFIAISVSDTGVGIAPENMEKLFKPLFSTKSRGAGLGLLVSRNLTEANGGRITVESRLGEGTSFSVMLPLWKE